ncbi:MAG: ABC transporter ATP-binding protein, partial [Alphaproteobacteria bacterium]
TVFQNMAFPLRSPSMRWDEARIKARVHEIARLLRIETKLDNLSTALSGGEMQRVAIGRALVRDPAVFLMDEPLSSLDARLREDLRVELKRIQEDLGATVLYVTHDQMEAMTMADRIGVLADGKLAQIGTPRQIYSEPDSVYVAMRLGSPQINLLPIGALGLTNGPAGAATVGVRPEDVILGQGGAVARVEAIEHLGAETVILIESEGNKVHALAGAGAMRHVGEETTVRMLPGTGLFFDQDGHRVAMARASEAEKQAERAHGT